jgi:WD40 repeat protein
VAASDGASLRVWDLKGRPPRPAWTLAAGNFSDLRFSRDERLLGAVTGPIMIERTVVVWELPSGKELARLRPHHVLNLDFSPDGTVLATASGDNTCKLFDLRTGREIATLRGQLLALFSVAFSPDGRRLATGTGGYDILIWDLNTGRDVLVLKGHKDGVTMLRFLPTGDALLSGDGKAFHLWRAPSWAEIEAVEKRRSRTSPLPSGALSRLISVLGFRSVDLRQRGE